MDAQAIEFAQRAVTALEAMATPHWAAVLGSVGGLAIGLVQCGLIYVGLRRMGQASEERKAQHQESMQTVQTQHRETIQTMQTQHEETMTALQQQGAVLADIGAGIRELLRDRNE